MLRTLLVVAIPGADVGFSSLLHSILGLTSLVQLDLTALDVPHRGERDRSGAATEIWRSLSTLVLLR